MTMQSDRISKRRNSEPEKAMRKLFENDFFQSFLAELDETGRQLAARRKNKVVTFRMNGQDLDQLKAMAQKYGVGYQTFISEILRELVRNGGTAGKIGKKNTVL